MAATSVTSATCRRPPSTTPLASTAPAAASAVHSRCEACRAPTSVTTSGPENSSVTATPSGNRMPMWRAPLNIQARPGGRRDSGMFAGVQLHLRGTASADAPAARRSLLLCAALAVVIVAVAGIAGPSRFSGPRWLTSVHLPTGHGHARGAAGPAQAPSDGAFPVWPAWIALALLAIAGLWLLYRHWPGLPLRRSVAAPSLTRDRIDTPAVQPAPPPTPEPVVRSGIEAALAALEEPREPADAVVRAWLGLQETAEASGIRRAPAETPTEFTARVHQRALTDDRAVRTLLRLYLRARFGDHPVSAADVASVRAALDELVAAWPGQRTPA